MSQIQVRKKRVLVKDDILQHPLRQHHIFPEVFPEAWASGWGEDEYGLWMSFTYKGVTQGFRWIEPGTFLMGSPESEQERSGDEIQHKVMLSQGFWMADTTVTQALWEAVMGENSSHFQGKNRPVETVNWDDAQAFISKMNDLKSELKLCLPSEAQWEYACRAGTTTPFHFGENISSEMVNYNGNHPYANGSKGEYREQTVEVKSLPCNSWGLHEMHGNVWEWCQDGYGDYPTDPFSDPEEPASYANHMLRGGSWGSYGRFVHSAYSGSDVSVLRSSSIGFRLARGH